jgi:hypothetical protein
MQVLMMAVSLKEKVERYELLFSQALETTKMTGRLKPELRSKGEEFFDMARSYFEDGTRFKEDGDMVNALVCFSYGHAWLDAGLRLGVFKGG